MVNLMDFPGMNQVGFYVVCICYNTFFAHQITILKMAHQSCVGFGHHLLCFHIFVHSHKSANGSCLRKPLNLMVYRNCPIEIAVNWGSDPFAGKPILNFIYVGLLVETRKFPIIMWLMESPSSSILVVVLDELQCCTNLKTPIRE